MRMLALALSVASVAQLACGSDDGASTDTRDTGAVPETLSPDVVVPDTTPDTSRPDTGVPDTGAPDTAGPRDPSCGPRVCGPAPGTFADCGTCATPGLFACNDGVCEAVCDPERCERMSWVDDTCESSGECDSSPDGERVTATYTCSGDRTACGAVFDAVDCGASVTDCQPCDLNGSKDGRCQFDECMPALAVECPEPACPDRECGPHPVTHEDCGACTTPGLEACNDGRCEAACDDAACARMGFSFDSCVSDGPCDGSPEGAVLTTTYACSADRSACEASASAVDCGLVVTDCQPCDFNASGDGRCEADACHAAEDTSCAP